MSSTVTNAAAQFARLVEIMATLRSPEGCAWDREQTTDTLKPYVLEEAYELVEAMDRRDHADMREELGDFLLEAVFVAQIESEAGHFSIGDSLEHISDKLVRRHPHVFARAEGEAPVTRASEVKARWEALKAQERTGNAAPKTLLGGLPTALPALLRAQRIGARAASVGFDWARTEDVMEKIREEVRELSEVVSTGAAGDHDRAEEEMGDLLFALANLSRKLGIEPETALRKANEKFTARFTAMERAIAESGRTFAEMTLDAMEHEWQRVKKPVSNAKFND